MSLLENKKSPLIAVQYLKKRLRRITAMGFHNLTVNEFNFSVHFTLHRNEKTIAFYTSESIENQWSPEWSYLEFPLSVQCLQDFVIRVWITSSNQCRLFLQYEIHLDDSLIPDEQKERVTKRNNTLWLDIFHYRFTDSENDPILPLPIKQRFDSAISYSRLSIIRMKNTINSIRTDNHTCANYLQQIRKCLEMNKEYLEKIKERECRQGRIDTLKQYLQFQIDLNQKRSNINQQKQKFLDERKIQLNRFLPQIKHQEEEFQSIQTRLAQSKSILHQLVQIIHYRQREIITEIYHYIYPIRHENQKGFFIANVNLPSAGDKIYESPSIRDRDQEIAAAMGYCSHFLLIISQVIHLPLRFPIDYHGIPIMKIYDYTLDTSEYPLYPTTNLSAFRYGFYLLNRNLGQLMCHCRVNDQNTDFRNTLENLKELLEEHFLHPHQNGVLNILISSFRLQVKPSAESFSQSMDILRNNPCLNCMPMMIFKSCLD